MVGLRMAWTDHLRLREGAPRRLVLRGAETTLRITSRTSVRDSSAVFCGLCFWLRRALVCGTRW